MPEISGASCSEYESTSIPSGKLRFFSAQLQSKHQCNSCINLLASTSAKPIYSNNTHGALFVRGPRSSHRRNPTIRDWRMHYTCKYIHCGNGDRFRKASRLHYICKYCGLDPRTLLYCHSRQIPIIPPPLSRNQIPCSGPRRKLIILHR